ncbi:MAG TPA: hypothetical protein VF834_11820 [Streptosporangiaceae bacterium]
MTRWQRGEAEIERMLADGELHAVATELIDAAEHLLPHLGLFG